MKPYHSNNQSGGDEVWTSTLSLIELQQQKILEGPILGQGAPWHDSYGWSDSGTEMASIWEEYIRGTYHLQNMFSHQRDDYASSAIDAAMFPAEDDRIIPFEIKYSTHNCMHYKDIHGNAKVSFYTQDKQIECLRPNGMVCNPTSGIWWPTDEAKLNPRYFYNFEGAVYSHEGYFIVGCVWKSSREGEGMTAHWIKISYSQFKKYFKKDH